MGTLYRNNRPYGASIEIIPTKVSELENDSGYITIENVPSKTSELENDSGYVTENDIPTKVSELENDSGYITIENVPTKVSELENDSNYQTETQISQIISPLEDEINIISPKLDQEISNRQTSDSNLEQLITSEKNNRINGDNSLQNYINDIQSSITELQSKLDDLKSLVPDQATAENKLADKDFVNSSIATNTANFIGTFNTLEELESQSATNNDYAFWRTTDSLGSVVFKRYKYVADDGTWQYEYDLNNSSFTEEQWKAINSGITEEIVARIGEGNVKTVNNIEPDDNKNVQTDVEISAEDYSEMESQGLVDPNKNYFVPDGFPQDIKIIDDSVVQEETTWSSEKISSTLNNYASVDQVPTKVSQLQNDSGFAIGTGKIYYVTIQPQTMYNATNMGNFISGYPVGSLIIFNTSWNSYQTYGWAGYNGYIMVTGGSAYAYGQARRYSDNKYVNAIRCTDSATNCSGWYAI